MTCDVCGRELARADRRFFVMFSDGDAYPESRVELAVLCVSCFLVTLPSETVNRALSEHARQAGIRWGLK